MVDIIYSVKEFNIEGKMIFFFFVGMIINFCEEHMVVKLFLLDKPVEQIHAWRWLCWTCIS